MSDLPEITAYGKILLAQRIKDNKKGFLGFGRGINADHEDMREKMFGHRSRFIKTEYKMPGGNTRYLHHCVECMHGIRNKSPRDHSSDCSWYREEALSKWIREGVEGE